MKPFDPKNKKGSGYPSRRNDRSEDSFNREDSRSSTHKSDALSSFSRDKRPRITRPDKPSGNTNGPRDGEQRRSFNPNFTKDNRRKGDFPEKPAREFSKPKSYGDRFNKEDRPQRSDSPRPWNKEGRPQHNDSSRPYNREDRPQRSDSPRPWNKEDRPRYNSSNDRDNRYNHKGGSGKKWSSKNNSGDNYPRYDVPKPQGAVRLNRFVANSGICSRREADDLIVAGVVTVNGKVITELGTKVNPEDEIRFNGEIIRGEKKVYLIMNKPKGYVTSVEDPHSDKTVMDLLHGACSERVYPVGRLDKNTVGVLLFTNDGELTRKLTHPSYNKQKIYQVTLDKALTENDLNKIAEGVTLEDGLIVADAVSYVHENRKEVGIEIHSGRNRIVRRIFESLGYTVQKLDRVYFAGLTKKRLKRGAWRFLTRQEVSMLLSGEYE